MFAEDFNLSYVFFIPTGFYFYATLSEFSASCPLISYFFAYFYSLPFYFTSCFYFPISTISGKSFFTKDFLSSPLFSKFFTLLVLMFPEWVIDVSLTFLTSIDKISRFFLVPVGLVIIKAYDPGFKKSNVSFIILNKIF